jgi:microcin C transport system substrate-binding protein
MMFRIFTPMLLILLAVSGCRDAREVALYDNTEEREDFYQRFNRETRERLHTERGELVEALAVGDLGEKERAEKERLLGDLERRLERPDFFEFLTEADLPDDLNWQTGMDQPEVGSPEARKGGTLHSYIPSGAYPPTIRAVGREANNSFRNYHWDTIEMAQVGLHPNTGKIIPGLADRWAVAEDGQTVYFHIDDEARWSDGREVTSHDWMMAFYVYLSPYLSEAFYRIYYSEQFWGISTYGDDYLCVRIAYPKPLAPYFASNPPFQEEFYREFGPDFELRYNWRPRPTTGAYKIREEDIHKGRSIAVTRVKDWWAKDRKYYRNRFNADRIEYRQIRDEEKIFQMFLRGDIDIYLLNDANKWYERTEIEQVFKGWIHRATFYNQYPRPSRGLYLNMSRDLLDDRDIRVGLSHATNWEKVIDTDLRGDAERLNLLNAGYVGISPKGIEAREFSVRKARESFARAGFERAGDDGILRDDRGRRLSFTINYTRHPALDSMMLRLKEEARRAGVEYKLEGMDSTSSFQKTSRKEHEIAFSGWAVSPPFPDYYQQFHSKEAYLPGSDDPRPMTNNITVFADPEVDPILEANRNARSFEEVRETSRRLEEIFHERAVWIPGYKRPFYRLGYWRWVRWPEDFNVRMASDPEDAHVHWLDPELKAETLKAMRKGESFEERNLLFDQYRGTSTSGPDEPAGKSPEMDDGEGEPASDGPGADEPIDEAEGGGDE